MHLHICSCRRPDLISFVRFILSALSIRIHLSWPRLQDHESSVFFDHTFNFRFLKFQQEKPIYKQSCPNDKKMIGITFSRFRVRFLIGSLVPGRVGLATLPSGGTGAPRNLGPVPWAQNRTIPDTMQWTLLNNTSSLPYPEPAYIEKDQLLQFYPMQQILWYISVSSPRRPQEWWYLANSSWVYYDDDGLQHIRWPYEW